LPLPQGPSRRSLDHGLPRRRPRRLWLLGLVPLLAALGGCRPAPAQGERAQLATPSPPPAARQTAVSFDLTADLPAPAVLQGLQEGTVTVLGVVTNRSAQAVREMVLRITLQGPSGRSIATMDSPALLPVLGPGQTSPYWATLPDPNESPVTAQVEVFHALPDARPSVALQTEVEQTRWLDNGRLALIGILHNPSGRPASLLGLVVMAVDKEARPTGVLSFTAGPRQIPGRGSVPFYAEGPAAGDTAAEFVYTFAVPSTGSSDSGLVFDAEPVLHTTAQGEAFIAGAIRNKNPFPVRGTVSLVVLQDEAVIGLAQLDFPLPMSAGETRVFSIRQPTLLFPSSPPSTGTPGPDSEWIIQGLAEGARVPSSEASPGPLPLELSRYEFTGSRLFLGGEVTNAGQQTHRYPTVLAAVRATDGAILGAASHLLAESMAPGERLSFVLAIDLPAGTDPAMAEYDLRALGIPVER
jgi:hypothetical protein